ncbi:hypothetical protein [Burkholderia cenocepacia]|uniref:hypothetical protein n=1 Tax=Burkholderia cenocepacia TaxID=95486 RepID=UPI002AB143FD|nr:hypothetical protein [Burkholderia cenocepacia]
MNDAGSTLYDLIEELRMRSPEHLDLFAALSDDDFQIAFDSLLGKALAGMEESKNNFQLLGEPALSAVLRLAMLVPGLSVSLEQHSNGHADLTFESYRLGIARRIVGEAKIHDGPRYHIAGIKQLLGYMTGREIRGLMVVYMRKPNGAILMKNVRETMDAELPEMQLGPTKMHPLKWAFDSLHSHSSGDSTRISHVTCNLHVAET